MSSLAISPNMRRRSRLLIADAAGGGVPVAAATYIGSSTATESTASSRRAAVHASTLVGDRVVVIISNRAGSAGVIDPTQHPTAVDIATAGLLCAAGIVVADADIVANGVLCSNLSTNVNIISTHTIRGGGTPNVAEGAFNTTAGWTMSGSLTWTFPTVNRTADEVVIWAFARADGAGTRTWSVGGSTETAGLSTNTGADLAHSVKIIGDTTEGDIDQTASASASLTSSDGLIIQIGAY